MKADQLITFAGSVRPFRPTSVGHRSKVKQRSPSRQRRLSNSCRKFLLILVNRATDVFGATLVRRLVDRDNSVGHCKPNNPKIAVYFHCEGCNLYPVGVPYTKAG